MRKIFSAVTAFGLSVSIPAVALAKPHESHEYPGIYLIVLIGAMIVLVVAVVVTAVLSLIHD